MHHNAKIAFDTLNLGFLIVLKATEDIGSQIEDCKLAKLTEEIAMFVKKLIIVCSALVLFSCNNDPVTPTPTLAPEPPSQSEILKDTIIAESGGMGLTAFIMPASDDFDNIPQDPSNMLTQEKVVLGKLLYHETALATLGVNNDTSGTWSCASCHHAEAGFKAGVPQGIGEGGEGFGVAGEGRVLASGFDGASMDPSLKPDVQPLTSPAVLNIAYQDVMLWNGQFGNAVDGIVNAGIDDSILATSGTPKAQNSLQLSGVETQAVAGTGVHRLKTSDDSIIQTNAEYIALFDAAYPNGSEDHTVDAAKAIAAFERTILANQSPFQEWLKGDDSAMNNAEIAGATLFFGKAGCVSCHTGPGLSSKAGASEDDMFFAIGFADFDPNHPQITGTVDDASSKGRGGFTREEADNYKFKVPQLYNLTDTSVFGHGASFTSVRDVVAYKNAAVAQKVLPASTFDPRFVSLGLTEEEIDQITAFLETGLYDPNLNRYVPVSLPSGNCFPVNDIVAKEDLGC